MANCKQLAAAPRRHQRLPASVLQPPHSPLTEDTSACGKAKHPGHAEPGGSSRSPTHSRVDSTPMTREGRRSSQRRTLLVGGSAAAQV